MRIGLATPVLTRPPGVSSPWEEEAGIDEIVPIAEAADRLGFEYLGCSEHIGIPSQAIATRGSAYWDPLATLSFLAAFTRNIRLLTQVLVLGYHHPLTIAKRYGTLDRISHGRLTLGLGVGSLREEFDLLQAPFTDRGARADDALAALRAAWGVTEPEYHGAHYDFDKVITEPTGLQAQVPIWIGGRSLRSLRRAVRFGDGWIPFGLGPAELTATLSQVTLPQGFDIVLSPAGHLDPISEPARAQEALAELSRIGATAANVRIHAESASHYCEQLEALSAVSDLVP